MPLLLIPVIRVLKKCTTKPEFEICRLLLILSVLKYIVKLYGVPGVLITPVWLKFRIKILQYKEFVCLSKLVLDSYFNFFYFFVTKSETALANIPLKGYMLLHSTTLNNFITFAQSHFQK